MQRHFSLFQFACDRFKKSWKSLSTHLIWKSNRPFSHRCYHHLLLQYGLLLFRSGRFGSTNARARCTRSQRRQLHFRNRTHVIYLRLQSKVIQFYTSPVSVSGAPRETNPSPGRTEESIRVCQQHSEYAAAVALPLL